MSLQIKRLGGSKDEPLCLEAAAYSTSASPLLWHLCRLNGLKVLAKKSYALTDDYEAYFQYKNRLFILYSPMGYIWISLIGQPSNEVLFSEIEALLGLSRSL